MEKHIYGVYTHGYIEGIQNHPLRSFKNLTEKGVVLLLSSCGKIHFEKVSVVERRAEHLTERTK